MAKLGKLSRKKRFMVLCGIFLFLSPILISFSLEFDRSYHKNEDKLDKYGDNIALIKIQNSFDNIINQDDDDDDGVVNDEDEDDGDDNEDDENKAQENLTYLFYILLTGGSAIVVTAYSIHKYKKWNLGRLARKEREIESQKLIEPSKSTEEILEDFKYKSSYLKIFEEENALEKISQLGDMNITTISEEFFEIIDKFEWEKEEKVLFIKEMLALPPSERDAILNNMMIKF